MRKEKLRTYFTAAPLGSIPELPALSCLEIKASEGNDSISGNFWLDPTGTGNAVLIDCDMASGGKVLSVLFELSYEVMFVNALDILNKRLPVVALIYFIYLCSI